MCKFLFQKFEIKGSPDIIASIRAHQECEKKKVRGPMHRQIHWSRHNITTCMLERRKNNIIFLRDSDKRTREDASRKVFERSGVVCQLGFVGADHFS